VKTLRSSRGKRAASGALQRKLVWTERSLTDLEAIGDYIARDNAAAAERWVLHLISVAEKAALLPFAGRRVPELARDDVRETFARAYRIVYRVKDDRVEVLTVFEGHRLFPLTVVVD
jgi:toxin ParE1/3/4